MISVPKEVYIAFFLSFIFWISIILSILVIGKSNEKVRDFKGKMIKNWKLSLTIAC